MTDDPIVHHLRSSRITSLVLALGCTAMALQYAVLTAGALYSPTLGFPGFVVTLFGAMVVNGGAAFFLVGAEAAGVGHHDPDQLSRAIALRTVGFALLGPASLTWVAQATFFAIVALV